MPAMASNRPRPPAGGLRGSRTPASAVASVGRAPRASSRLTAYSPVATIGATSGKPVKAPVSSRTGGGPPAAARRRTAPTPARAAAGQRQRIRSLQPRSSQPSGRSVGMRTVKLRDSVRTCSLRQRRGGASCPREAPAHEGGQGEGQRDELCRRRSQRFVVATAQADHRRLVGALPRLLRIERSYKGS